MSQRLTPVALVALVLTACSSEQTGGDPPPPDGGPPHDGGVCTGEIIPLPEPEGSPPTINQCSNPWPMARATIDYSGNAVSQDPDLVDAVARRFEFTIGGERNAQAYFENPGSIYRGAYIYNSLTDNYVTADHDTREHDWLMANGAAYGITGEDAYLHFWTDTVVQLEGQEVTIPGWQPDSPKTGASAGSREESRVPVYFADLSRRATNFASPAVRELHRDFNIENILNVPLFGDTYPLGIMFDNTGYAAPWTGLRVEIVNANDGGGQVAEHPTHLAIGAEGFEDWRWFEGVGLFMKELRDYLVECPEVVGNRPVTLAPNVAAYVGNVLENSLELLSGGGFVLCAEFEYNPARLQGEDRPIEIFQAELAANAAGVAVFHPGYATTEISGYAGSYTRDQAAMNGLALEWVIRTANDETGVHSTLQGVQVNSPVGEGFETNLLGVFDIDLGRPLGDPYLLTRGTDGAGYPYAVYARDFACGISIVRARGEWSENIDETTAIDVTLPESLSPVDCNGATLAPTTTWTLRNGQGQIFLRAN